VGEFAGGEVIRSTSGDALKVDGLALRKDGRTRVLMANLSPETQQVSVQGLDPDVRVHRLDETIAEAAMSTPEAFRAEEGQPMQTTGGTLRLSLLPYAVVRVDSA